MIALATTCWKGGTDHDLGNKMGLHPIADVA